MEDLLKFDAPKHRSSMIKVIGVGGCGTNIANHLFNSDFGLADFIVCNTDATHLEESPIPVKIQLGDDSYGAGMDPEAAREAAEAVKDQIKQNIGNDAEMIFITAGFGNGTGTGASPVIAEAIREIEDETNKEILVIAIITYPPIYEGNAAKERADNGIEKLKKAVDATIIIDNNKLVEFEEMTIKEIYAMVDEILVTAVKCVYDMTTQKARIRLDLKDMKKILRNTGAALMGIGVADGENRAIAAIERATTSCLLNDQDYSDAKNVLVSIASSPEAIPKGREINEIMNYIRNTMTSPSVNIKQSLDYSNASLENNLKVAIIAAGFSTTNIDNVHRITVIEHVEDTTSTIQTPSVDLVDTQQSTDTIIVEYSPTGADKVEDSLSPVSNTTTTKVNVVTYEPPYPPKSFPEVDEETKAKQIARIAERVSALSKWMSEDSNIQRSSKMSMKDIYEEIGFSEEYSDLDNLSFASLPAITSRVNENGEIDNNRPAFMNDKCC